MVYFWVCCILYSTDNWKHVFSIFIGMMGMAPSRWRKISKQINKMDLLNVFFCDPFKFVQICAKLVTQGNQEGLYRIRLSRNPSNSKTDWDIIWATNFRISETMWRFFCCFCFPRRVLITREPAGALEVVCIYAEVIRQWHTGVNPTCMIHVLRKHVSKFKTIVSMICKVYLSWLPVGTNSEERIERGSEAWLK